MQRPPVLVIPVGSTGSAFYNALNTNFTLLADALEKALDRFGSLPNQMESNLDMNSFRIINCADPINPSDVVTLRHLRNEIASYIAATKVTWRGLWAPGVSYEPWDLVHHNGSVYINIQAHNSTAADEPGVGANWTNYWDIFLGFLNLQASGVDVNACPTGPINSNTDAQSAFCTLSDAINNIIVGNTPPSMNLDDLQDVNAPTPTPNQALFWNGTVWVPADINPANIQINACPTGPVNSNMDLQSAICALSSFSGRNIAVVEWQDAANTNINIPNGTNINFNTIVYDSVGITLSPGIVTLPNGYYLITVFFATNFNNARRFDLVLGANPIACSGVIDIGNFTRNSVGIIHAFADATVDTDLKMVSVGGINIIKLGLPNAAPPPSDTIVRMIIDRIG